MSFHVINEVTDKYRYYTIQVEVIKTPLYIQTQQCTILSIIATDYNKDTIEIVAFNEQASKYYKIIKVKHVYDITNAMAIPNKKYKKTNHDCKLKLTAFSNIKQNKSKQYLLNGRICVKLTKETKCHQASILNWLNK